MIRALFWGMHYSTVIKETWTCTEWALMWQHESLAVSRHCLSIQYGCTLLAYKWSNTCSYISIKLQQNITIIMLHVNSTKAGFHSSVHSNRTDHMHIPESSKIWVHTEKRWTACPIFHGLSNQLLRTGPTYTSTNTRTSTHPSTHTHTHTHSLHLLDNSTLAWLASTWAMRKWGSVIMEHTPKKRAPQLDSDTMPP